MGTLKDYRRIVEAARMLPPSHPLREAYNPDQPRDADGKWGSGGGSDPKSDALKGASNMGQGDTKVGNLRVGDIVKHGDGAYVIVTPPDRDFGGKGTVHYSYQPVGTKQVYGSMKSTADTERVLGHNLDAIHPDTRSSPGFSTNPIRGFTDR